MNLIIIVASPGGLVDASGGMYPVDRGCPVTVSRQDLLRNFLRAESQENNEIKDFQMGSRKGLQIRDFGDSLGEFGTHGCCFSH